MNNNTILSYETFADLLGVSIRTLDSQVKNGKVKARKYNSKKKYIVLEDNDNLTIVSQLLNSTWEHQTAIIPYKKFTSIELFAGAGGLAIGMEKAGLSHIFLNEIDKDACATLKRNRPEWNVCHDDIRNVDFTSYCDRVDVVSGGFPCQAFSYAGNKGGFNDTRGTLFFELARAVKEIRPKVLVAENVKGLLTHDNGRTIHTIKNVISELGYTLIEPQVLRALMFKVPQKRERLFLIAVRNDLAKKAKFNWPSPYNRVMTLNDAFLKGELYNCDVPKSVGAKYPPKKQKVLELVPQGGCWKDLPINIQESYMGKSFTSGGGKTGIARRLSMTSPSLTLTCSPAQKQTERCHPTETRPLTIREYARIQTFPDEWEFMGSVGAQYKQIGNAVPCNLGYAVAKSVVALLNELD